MSTYTVIARRWEHGWELDIREGEREVGTTQSRSLAAAERMVRDYLAVDTGAAPESFDLEILPEVPAELAERVRLAREGVARLAEVQRQTAEASRDVARELDRVGYSGPDIAAVLHVSKQRVSQLLAAG